MVLKYKQRYRTTVFSILRDVTMRMIPWRSTTSWDTHAARYMLLNAPNLDQITTLRWLSALLPRRWLKALQARSWSALVLGAPQHASAHHTDRRNSALMLFRDVVLCIVLY